IESSAVAAMRTRIDLVKEARALFGPARAATLWGKLGLPAVPPPPPTGIAEAEACLRYLLNWVPDGLENGSIRQNIEIALQDDEECRIAMRAHGIRVSPDMNEEGFIVSNRSSSLVKHFANTEWANYRWYRVLRRLPDTTNIGPMKYDAPVAMRGTFIPASYLDENPQIVR
ncbi:MAG: hypothetical protein JKY94_11060, partial [Rhodobacteraceae bacterium]|nr:hypothetical protein [Paracoccaceae bacterium]